jgi:hypothetical protein
MKPLNVSVIGAGAGEEASVTVCSCLRSFSTITTLLSRNSKGELVLNELELDLNPKPLPKYRASEAGGGVRAGPGIPVEIVGGERTDLLVDVG